MIYDGHEEKQQQQLMQGIEKIEIDLFALAERAQQIQSGPRDSLSSAPNVPYHKHSQMGIHHIH